jgi:hypothetical protein
MIDIEYTTTAAKDFSMKCPATRAARLAAGPGSSLRRTFLIVASLVVVTGSRAAEVPLPVASANYSVGVAQLRVNAVSQLPSTQNRRGFAASLELQLEIPPADKPGVFFQLPGGWYLDNDATPLTAVSVVPGKNLAKTPHQWAVDGKTGRITLTDLEIGEARARLQGVELELVLTKVVEWETRTFQTQPGRSDFFLCGPFELRASGDPQSLRVEVWAYPQFREDHERYRRQMPVAFLNSSYGLQELKVVDAANRAPTSTGTSMPLTGAASSTFTGWKPLEGSAEATAAPTSDDIVYPVSISMRLPKRFEKQRVKFQFSAIPLPPPETAARK